MQSEVLLIMLQAKQMKNIAKNMLESYLISCGINTKHKFHCLNPTHKDEHPSMSYKNNRVKCFSCGFGGDIFDVVSLQYGLSNYKDIFKKTYDLLGLKSDETNHHTSFELDLTNEVLIAHRNIESHIEHLNKRGMSKEIIDKYKIGYSPDGYNSVLKAYPRFQSKSNKQKLYKYIFPFLNSKNKCDYIIAEIYDRKKVDTYNKKYKNMKGIPIRFFNDRYLLENGTDIIFIVEGIYDALSVEEIGKKALALNSISNIDSFVGLCKKCMSKKIFIIGFDNDSRGRSSALKLKSKLNKINMKSYIFNICANYKDPNEFLVNDRDNFFHSVTLAYNKVRDTLSFNNAIGYKIKNSAVFAIDKMFEDSDSNIVYRTGFRNFDNMLGGGLVSGLYVIGALSSIGKTTFVLQIIESIAMNYKKDILFFSLEMSSIELVAKGLSRLSFSELEDKSLAGTSAEIMSAGKNFFNQPNLHNLLEFYRSYAENIYFVEGNGELDTYSIRKRIEEHIKVTGSAPVIVIDYLQIIKPCDSRINDKQNVDRIVSELKRISRDFRVPVIVISSLNRESYNLPINMAAFKESGTIEYSSDVLIGLQMKGVGESGFNIDTAKMRDPRQIELKILKNRNGKTGGFVNFLYYPAYSYFVESQ